MTEVCSVFEKKLKKGAGRDEVYCAIKNEINPHCQKAKVFVDRLWATAHSYLDPDLPDKLSNQFHQHFWELYLATSLIEVGLALEHSSSSDGPDICIKPTDDSCMWVEAVTAGAGQGIDAVQEAKSGTTRDVPMIKSSCACSMPLIKKAKSTIHTKRKTGLIQKIPILLLSMLLRFLQQALNLRFQGL